MIAVEASADLGDRSRGDVDDTGEEFTSDLEPRRLECSAEGIHVGVHQEETLGGGEGGTEKTTDEGAVKSTSGTGFGLDA